MLSPLRDWLVQRGVAEGAAVLLTLAADIAVVLVLAAIADYVVKRVVVRRAAALAARSASDWDDVVARHRVLDRLVHVAPALVIYHFAAAVLADYAEVMAVVRQAALIYMLLVTAVAADRALNAVVEIARASRVPRGLPVKGIVQVAKLVLYAVVAISVLSLVLGQSPLLMLSGLGAMSAVLMLIFRDAILGFVAGIQLAMNRMVQRGDWIEMPKHGVDGDVLEVGLTTVKVQNFDNTTVTIPTYALISESFKNWRGMFESRGRRIKRAINIDVGSVRFCTEEMLARFVEIRHIAEYVTRKREEVARWNAEHGVDASDPINGRHLTNLGTFRAYVVAYLRHHPMVHQEMTFLVRQLDPTEHGLPIEIYVFSRDQDWVRYEDIQADIFDHLLAIVPRFDLRVFQSPSGPDVERVLASVAGRSAAASAARRSAENGSARRP